MCALTQPQVSPLLGGAGTVNNCRMPLCGELRDCARDAKFRLKSKVHDSWDDLQQEVEDREMPYATQFSLLHKFGAGGEAGSLPDLIDTFRTHVLERKLDWSDCEVLLATACGAKGLEWDNIKVLDDYRRLSRLTSVWSGDAAGYGADPSDQNRRRNSTRRRRLRASMRSWQRCAAPSRGRATSSRWAGIRLIRLDGGSQGSTVGLASPPA